MLRKPRIVATLCMLELLEDDNHETKVNTCTKRVLFLITSFFDVLNLFFVAFVVFNLFVFLKPELHVLVHNEIT